MEKFITILKLILSGTVTIAIVLWLFSTKGSVDSIKLLISGLLIVVGIFSFFINLKSLKKNELRNH
jgi:hypothetical protein